MIDFGDPEQRAAAAGEYVLGTLSAEDHQQVADALRTDGGLRAEVYAWQDRLLALSARSPAERPSPALWTRIDGSVGQPLGRAPGPSAADGPQRPSGPAAPPRSARPPARPPWWQRLGLWQGLTAAAMAATVAMAVLLVNPGTEPDAPQERYVALLQSPDGAATGWVVEVSGGQVLRLKPVGAPNAVPAGRTWQFWTKAEGAAGPTSLGLVQAGQTLELPVSRLPAVGERQLFEITLEPEGGSTIGRPTGPILYLGRSVRL